MSANAPARLRICQIIPTLDQGGAEKQMALLATHLDRELFESHVVVLTHSGPYEKQLRDAGVHVHIIGKRGKLDPTALGRLTAKLRQLKPDVAHTWLFAANSYGRVAAWRAGVPVIVAAERSVDPWKKWWHYAIDRQLLRWTDTIATNTSAVSEFYAQHGIPASKFSVIPNAVLPHRAASISRDEFFRRLDIPPRGRIVGAVGRLWHQKGYRDLIWAAELLRVAYQDVYLVIVGDGPERASLLNYRDKVGSQDAVRFVGHRTDAEELMSAFDLLWNGSLYEGQSNTILEAMMRGIPVIASNIPGNRDLVAHGQTGFLFDLSDTAALTKLSNKLLRDDDARAAMGQQAQQRADEHFSLGNMISTYQRLYQRLSDAKPR